MTDPRIERLAAVLVEYSVAVRPGDLVWISGSTLAEPAAVALYRAVLRAGGHPWIRLTPADCDEVFFKEASRAQLEHTSPFEMHLVSRADVRIAIWAEQNTRQLTAIDPARQALNSRARQPILQRFLKRAAIPPRKPGRLRWVGTLFPTPASAQDAEMSLTDYERFVFHAGKLDQPDPAAAWRKAGEAQQRLADVLNRGREMHITAPNGTDIRFGVQGRRWINCDGHENFPDGEVFTGPIEDATEGTVCFSFPAIEEGREVLDVRLVFRRGRVVECSASKNEDFLIHMLDQDKGARILGELALGTNYGIQQFTRNTLFDEKIGGTFHAALGAAYPESGGRNKSGLHWDMVCDLRKGGLVKLDGKVISRNGRFTNASWPRPR